MYTTLWISNLIDSVRIVVCITIVSQNPGFCNDFFVNSLIFFFFWGINIFYFVVVSTSLPKLCWNLLVTNIMTYRTFRTRSAYYPCEESGPGMGWLPWQQAPDRREVLPSVLCAHLNFCHVKMVQRPSPDVAPQYWTHPVPELFEISFHRTLPSYLWCCYSSRESAQVPVHRSCGCPVCPVLCTAARGGV